MNRAQLQLLTQDWRRMLQYRDALFLVGLLLWVLAPLFWLQSVYWEFGLASGILSIGLVFLYYRRVSLPQAVQVAQHLDRTYPQLEESCMLWLRTPVSLSLLERLQLARLDRTAEQLFSNFPLNRFPGEPPWKLLRGGTLFLAGSVCAILAIGLFVPHHVARRAASALASNPVTHLPPVPAKPSATVWPKIIRVGLTITPPDYTGRPSRQTSNMDAEIEENAVVAWDITLDGPVRDARFVFNAAVQTPLLLQPTSELTQFRGALTFTEACFYSFAATLSDGTAWNPPDLHALKLIKDQPPTLRVLQPDQARTVVIPPSPIPYLFVPFGVVSLPSSFILHPSSFPVAVAVLAGDDYGLTDVHLVATVAKGSGEAVKFREQVIGFDEDSPSSELPHARRLMKTLDLPALGLEPGDELYFFIEARDNRPPTPNRTRSETRFVTLRGPATSAATAGRGVAGINLIPQYFRSERQIIIDTEKLLADRPTLPDDEFRLRANDLGADQALLRLRYGRFLGEDQEESAVTDHTEFHLDPLHAQVPSSRPGPRAAASIALRFQQEHEEQAEGGGGDTRGVVPRHAPERPLSAEEIRAPYVDEHDSQDAATLFDHAAKGTMRDALSAMWQAEGLLRTARPQEALAPEHRALDILKEVQQSDRAYVQHVGFEAPPLKLAERRLKGDVSDVTHNAVAAAHVLDDPIESDVRTALSALSQTGLISPAILRRAEPALMAAAAHQPDDFLTGLQALRRLEADPAPTSTQDRPLLTSALLRLLPAVHRLPETGTPAASSLAAPYFQALQASDRRHD